MAQSSHHHHHGLCCLSAAAVKPEAPLTPAPEPPQAAVAGVLRKWTSYGRGWRERWFSLCDGVLSYSKIRSDAGGAGLAEGEDGDVRLIGGASARISGGRLPEKPAGVVFLKEERQKRMLGTAESSGEEEDDEDEDDRRMKLDNSKPISGDDLYDSFSLDESTKRKRGWVDEIYEKEGKEIGEDAVALMMEKVMMVVMVRLMRMKMMMKMLVMNRIQVTMTLVICLQEIGSKVTTTRLL